MRIRGSSTAFRSVVRSFRRETRNFIYTPFLAALNFYFYQFCLINFTDFDGRFLKNNYDEKYTECLLVMQLEKK